MGENNRVEDIILKLPCQLLKDFIVFNLEIHFILEYVVEENTKGITDFWSFLADYFLHISLDSA